ncbi:MAG: dihydrodipicolinate synthase family protein [Chloroflexi bacterium]|nr:dihydrodipicolinate synthase family protein [Chloroflexota bacterium]
MDVSSKTNPKADHGVVVPLITPVTADGKLDEHALRRVIDHVIQGGVQGIFVLGTTGEGPSVPRAMRSRLVHVTVEHAARRARIYAGISDTSMADSIAAAADYLHHGVDVVVAQLPNYYKLTPDEQFEYFAGLARHVQGSMLLYNIPSTVHMSIDLGVIEHLRAFSNVVGIKDSSGDREMLEALVEQYGADPGFSVLSGSIKLASYGLRLGADGYVPSTANIEPALCSRLYASSLKGDWSLMEQLQAELNEATGRFTFDDGIGPSIARLKRMMAHRGLCGPKTFPPIEEADESFGQ